MATVDVYSSKLRVTRTHLEALKTTVNGLYHTVQHALEIAPDHDPTDPASLNSVIRTLKLAARAYNTGSRTLTGCYSELSLSRPLHSERVWRRDVLIDVQQVMDMLEDDLQSLGASRQMSWDLPLSVISVFDGTEDSTLSGHPSPGPRTSTPRPGLVLDVPDAKMVLVSTPGSASDPASPRPLVSPVPNVDTSH